ncbi:DEAD/DEAH box helicase [bacterium]|nr:MAG: DEAD/DEAH box helicase [bacterium]
MNGEKIILSYRIVREGEKIDTPRIPSLNEINVMRLPAGIWTKDVVKAAQDAWRRITIHDPVLNRRFRSDVAIERTPYQVEAVEKILDSLHSNGNALVVMATGAGKTFVGFDAMHRYLEERRRKLSEVEDPGPVLFLVDNTIILSEAEKALHRFYPGKYSTGRIYGGNGEGEAAVYDKSTDVIFATVKSLISSNGKRLEALLEVRKTISAVVVDEVHHLPAGTHRKVFNRIQGHSLLQGGDRRTVFIGLTATEVRPDRASVLEFFGNEVTYEYTIDTGWEEGFLTRMNYNNRDEDIIEWLQREGMTVGRGGVIEEGTPTYQAYRSRQYSNARFPFLLEQYKLAKNGRPDDRTLILAPNIERARALAAYFSAHGVSAISLTSQDKNNNPEWFDHAYDAWKAGKWREGSLYSSHTVPKVVVAVSLFREGADVPAINTVILWADTNSTIRFVQGIGRGLRPAQFKTHLTVIDAVGLNRKVHLMQYLFSLVSQERKSQELDVTSTDSDEGILDPHTLQERLNSPEAGIMFSPDVTKRMEDVFADVPTRLEMRHNGDYSLITEKEKEMLDKFIASRLGFGSPYNPQKLQNFIRGLVQMLEKTQAGDNEIKNAHDSLLPAFYVLGLFEASDNLKEIPLHATTIIVFSRIIELMKINAADHGLEDDSIYRLFPEFHPKRRDILQWRTRNLRVLREMAFGLDIRRMTENLIYDYLKKHGEFNLEDEVGGVLSAEQESLDDLEEQPTLLIFYAEGEKERTKDARNARYQPPTSLYETGTGWNQRGLIQAYLGHSHIQGKLELKDFDLPTDEFIKLIAQRGLIKISLARETFLESLSEGIKDYRKALRDKKEQNIEEPGNRLLGLLQDQNNKRLVSSRDGGEEQEGFLSEVRENWKLFKEMQPGDRQGEGAPWLHADIRKSFEDLLEIGNMLNVFRPDGLPSVRITVEEVDGKGDYELTFTDADSAGAASHILISAREDFFDRTNVFLRTDHHDSQISQLTEIYQKFEASQRRILANELIKAISFIGKSAESTEGIVYVIPGGNELFSALLDTMLDTDTGIEGYVLGPVQGTVTTDYSWQSYAMMPTIEMIKRSSLPPELEPLEIERIQRFVIRAGFGPRLDPRLDPRSDPAKVRSSVPYNHQLAKLYAFIYAQQLPLLPAGVRKQVQIIFEKLESFKANNEANSLLADEFEYNLRWLLLKFVDSPGLIKLLENPIHRIFRLLEASDPNLSLSITQIKSSLSVISFIFSQGALLSKYLTLVETQQQPGTNDETRRLIESELEKFLDDVSMAADQDYYKMRLDNYWPAQLSSLIYNLFLEGKKEKAIQLKGHESLQTNPITNTAQKEIGPSEKTEEAPPALKEISSEEEAAVKILNEAVSEDAKRIMVAKKLSELNFSTVLINSIFKYINENGGIERLGELSFIQRFNNAQDIKEVQDALWQLSLQPLEPPAPLFLGNQKNLAEPKTAASEIPSKQKEGKKKGENSKKRPRSTEEKLLGFISELKNPLRSTAAISALEKIYEKTPDPRIVNAILAAVGNGNGVENSYARNAAISALGRISEKTSDPRIVDVLLDVVRNGNGGEKSYVREAAISALEKISGKTPDPRIADALLAVIGNGKEDTSLREAAIFALGQFSGLDYSLFDALVKTLIAVAKDKGEDLSLREAAIRKLTKTPDIRAAAAIIELLKDEYTFVFRVISLDKRAWDIPDFFIYRVDDDNLVDTFISALESESNIVRAIAINALGKISGKTPDPRIVDALIAVVGNGKEDLSLRNTAVSALEKIYEKTPDPRIVHALLAAVGSGNGVENSYARNAAISALGRISEKTSDPRVNAIISAAGVSSPFASSPLGKEENPAEPPSAASPIAQANSPVMKDNERTIRRYLGILSNTNLPTDKFSKTTESLIKIILDMISGQEKIDDNLGSAIKELISISLKRLDDPYRDSFRLSAAIVLGKILDKVKDLKIVAGLQVIPALFNRLRDDDEDDVRSAVIETIAVAMLLIEDEPLKKDISLKLIPLLGDKPGSIRLSVARFLVKHKDLRAVPALIEALKDEYQLVSQLAAEALGELKDPRAVLPLIMVLRDKDEDWLVRQAAAEALGELKDLRAVSALIEALKDEYVRSIAVQALGKIVEELPQAEKQALSLPILVGFLQHGDILHSLFDRLRQGGLYSDIIYNRAITAYAQRKGWVGWQTDSINVISYGLLQDAKEEFKRLGLKSPDQKVIPVGTQIEIQGSQPDEFGFIAARLKGESSQSEEILLYQPGFKAWQKSQRSVAGTLDETYLLGIDPDGYKIYYLLPWGEVLSCCTMYGDFLSRRNSQKKEVERNILRNKNQEHWNKIKKEFKSIYSGIVYIEDGETRIRGEVTDYLMSIANLSRGEAITAIASGIILDLDDISAFKLAVIQQYYRKVSGHAEAINERIAYVKTLLSEELDTEKLIKEAEQLLNLSHVSLLITEPVVQGLGLNRGLFEENIPARNLFELLGYLETIGLVPQVGKTVLPLAQEPGISLKMLQLLQKGELTIKIKKSLLGEYVTLDMADMRGFPVFLNGASLRIEMPVPSEKNPSAASPIEHKYGTDSGAPMWILNTIKPVSDELSRALKTVWNNLYDPTPGIPNPSLYDSWAQREEEKKNFRQARLYRMWQAAHLVKDRLPKNRLEFTKEIAKDITKEVNGILGSAARLHHGENDAEYETEAYEVKALEIYAEHAQKLVGVLTGMYGYTLAKNGNRPQQENPAVPASGQTPENVGGIDLNPAGINLEVKKKEGASAASPLPSSPLITFDIKNFQGFTFQIIKIEPVRDVVSLIRG